jgi:hypothetical protein
LRSRPGPQPRSSIVKGRRPWICCNSAMTFWLTLWSTPWCSRPCKLVALELRVVAPLAPPSPGGSGYNVCQDGTNGT